MAPNLPPGIRQLPIYREGFRAGVDAGLVYAMSAITAERGRQERLSDARSESGRASRHDFAVGCLLDVTHVLAARFRGGRHA